MLPFRSFRIRCDEKGLLFREGDFVGLLGPGRYRFFDLLRRIRVDVVNQRDPWLTHPDPDLIVLSDRLEGEALVLDLEDSDRALVWIDGRVGRVLGPGLHVA